MEELTEKFDKFSEILHDIKCVNGDILNRLDRVEAETKSLAHGRDLHDIETHRGASCLDPGPALADGKKPDFECTAEGSPAQQQDLQAEFATLKDALQKVKLPADLILNESKSGIRKDDQHTLTILGRSARYSEVALKLMSTWSSANEVTESDLKQIISIHYAHMRFLQDEYANLVVLGKYPKETAQMFRSLQKNTSGLSSEALKNLKLAVEVTAQSQTQVNSSPSTGRGRGFFGRGRGFNNYRRGFNRNFSHQYQDHHTQGFPFQNPARADDN